METSTCLSLKIGRIWIISTHILQKYRTTPLLGGQQQHSQTGVQAEAREGYKSHPARLAGQHSPSTAKLLQGSHMLQWLGQQKQHTGASIWNPTGGCVRALSTRQKSQCFRAGEWRDKYSVASNLITHTSSRRKARLY